MQVVIGVDLEPEQSARLRAAFPDLEFIEAIGQEKVREAIPSAEVLFGGRPSAELLAAAPHLRWVQTYSAGVNGIPMEEMAGRKILLTNASGAHGIPISENILAMMLAFAIRIPTLVRAQDKREWVARTVGSEKFNLEGQTLLVIGLGGIGSCLARKASSLGLKVLGMRNRSLPPPPGVSELLPFERLSEALGRADHVALCLPLTDATTAFLGESELRTMKPTAYVYNVGRGKSIEREALLCALQEGWIAGAGLDVTDPEPLPSDDLLWSFPNVLLSQHTSGGNPDLDRLVTDIFLENLRLYRAGEPLNNLVDFERGY